MTFEDVKQFFEDDSCENYIILSHKNPDGDTLGCAFALCRVLRQMGKAVTVRCHDGFPERYSFLYEGYDDGRKPEENERCRVVAVDIADTKLLGESLSEYAKEGSIDLCIDHHISNKMYAKQTYVDGDAPAAALILYELFVYMGREIDRQTATCLYTGIATDTGCFKYESTNARAHIAAAQLMEKGIDYANINRRMFDIKSRSRIEVEQAAMANMEYGEDGRMSMMIITQDMVKKSGADEAEFDGLASLPLTVEGVQIGITVRQRGEQLYKLSVRTTDKFDASAFCQKFGGGGHVRAAGCELSGTLDEVKRQIRDAVSKLIEENE